MTSLCSSCGFKNPPGMRFCGNCGSRLADAPLVTEALAAPDAPLEPPGTRPLGPMVGADLLERFRQAGLEAAGQRRNVTVLFVDLSDYTRLSSKLDPEDLYDLIQQYIHLLANDVYKYEGMVDKFTGDGLMALFGAPITHENNAELAVLAALDMLKDVAELSRKLKGRLGVELRVHIGLHSGIVIVGGIGSNLLMNYTAIGDTVNLARRLEDAAPPGIILASETVYRQTKPLVVYNPSPTLTLKGISYPITCYQVVRLKEKPDPVRGVESLRAPMIGRDEELGKIRLLLDRLVEDRRGAFVLVTGEAGIGKSRLKSEIKALLSQTMANVIEGQSLTYRRLVAYWIFIDALRNWLGVAPDTPEPEVREKLANNVKRALGGRAVEALPYLENLLSLDPSDAAAAERIHYLDAGQLRQQVFLAVRDLLMAEARRQPLLLILEDLHWADPASIELLLFLLESSRQAPRVPAPNVPDPAREAPGERGTSLMILAISRPLEENGMSRVASWAEGHLGEACCAIRLQSLSLDQCQRLLFQLLETSELPPALQEQILQRSAGIPFYLEEILRMLIDQGMLRREGGHWKLASGTRLLTLSVPDTLEGLILARFDRLAEEERRILQVASAIGRQFSLPVLAHVLESMDEGVFRSRLGGLVEREFLMSQPDSQAGEYSFRHVLTSDAIYKTILRRERAELHGQIGEAIEAVYAQRLESQVEILARHYSWSTHYDRALHYLILAGQKASRSYANEQARQHYELALETLPKAKHLPYHALQVHSGLADVLVFVGEYAAARQHYQLALKAIAGEDPDLFAEERSTVLRKIGTTHERQGDYDQALGCLKEAQLALDSAPVPLPAERAQIYNDIGWIHFRRGGMEEADQNLSLALSLAEETTAYDVIASIYNRLGGVAYQKGHLDQASNYVRKSLVVREEMGDTVAVARSYSNLGLLGWRKGDWDGALENFRRSAALHATLGDVEGAINVHSNIGLLLTDKGELEEARKHLEEALQGARQIGHSFMEGLCYHHLSRFWLGAREWKKSLDYSNQALLIFTEIKAQEHLVDLYASMGEAWLGLGRPAEARQAGEMGKRLVDEAHQNASGDNEKIALPERGRILRLLGNVALAQGDLEGAAQLLKESASHFTALGNQLELGRSLVSLAALAQKRSDRTAARLHLNEARLIFRHLGAKLDLQSVDNLI